MSRIFGLLVTWLSVSVFPALAEAENLIWRGGYGDVGLPVEEEIVVDKFKKALIELGIEVELTSYPTIRSVLMLDRGQLDIELGRVESVINEYPTIVKLDVPILTLQFSLIRLENALKVDSLEELNGKRVMLRKGSLFLNQLRKKHPEIIFLEYIDRKQAFKNLNRNRVDYALVPDVLGSANSVPLGFRKEVLYQFSIYPSISQKNANWKVKLEAELKKHFPITGKDY